MGFVKRTHTQTGGTHMKLTSRTKDNLTVGTVLKDSIRTYMISNLWKAGRSTYITLTDTETKQNIYGMPISTCYGMEII